jgi:lysophospholipase L1-like esterase
MRQLALILALLLVTGSAHAEIKPDERIWLIGDSNGFLIYPLLAAKASEAKVPFGGDPIAGSSVIQWASSLHKEHWRARAFKPTLILVALGANDACMGTRIVSNEPPYLTALLGRLKRTGASRIVWLGPPKIGSTEPKVCHAMKDCLARAVPGLDAFKAMVVASSTTYLDGRDSSAEMGTDLLHPTLNGRATWVNWVWNQLTQ